MLCQVRMEVKELKAPTGAMPDLDADARKELERVEAGAKRTPIPVHKALCAFSFSLIIRDHRMLEVLAPIK